MTIPFSPYDFFGYLVAGFVVLCSVERAAGMNWIINQDLKLTPAAFWLGVAYIIGHIVANVSSYFIEHKFLRGLLGCPEDLLFTDEPPLPPRLSWKERLTSWRWWLSWINPMAWWRWIFPLGWRRRLFPIYCKPLPAETRQRVLTKSEKHGFVKPGRALFFHCHAIVKRDKTTMERMTSFLNLYGFCRNVCMAALITLPILLWGAFKDAAWRGWEITGTVHADLLWWAAAATLVAFGMLYRYVKFFRHYTLEVFVTYAEYTEPAKNPS